ncbi:hypothetical protein PsorP6_013995 [Peronosclerospora sorghi]|uniref:Uncharacterized protein n=1 Tax=Peronosclerospora sorghi TaxID=230839 RepID=A0ACC0VFS6_9STRA|nr:hypothetical protein PsorP6_013995 [Peronosclerospora sorghi]
MRTLIICCVTPSYGFIEETKNTLQFAARQKDIKTLATVNEVLDDQTHLRRLMGEVHELRNLTKKRIFGYNPYHLLEEIRPKERLYGTKNHVINALATPGVSGQNAPFRDSKLTRFFQNSLGGDTRTLIICCVTPSERFIEETKITKQFASRAKDIKTLATVNEVLDDQTHLRRLMGEVHELRNLTKKRIFGYNPYHLLEKIR